MNAHLFGTSGIRGHAKKIFTNQFSFDLGRAFAIFLKNHNQKGKVAIGNDPRESSPRIKAALSSGIIYESFEVFDEGVAPIPSLNTLLKADPSYVGSVMVSGSHVKAELNGLKFFAFGEEILKEHEAEIEKIYYEIKEKVNYTDKSDVAISDDKALTSYKEYLLSKAKGSYPFWKVVVDPGNGAQSDVMPWVFRQLGLNVIEINSSVQLLFLSRDTEVEGDFTELQKKVLEEKANLGVGYDSDGDRVVFIDEKGNFIPGDYSGTLIAKDYAFDSVITPINTSQVVESLGKKVFRTRVGSPYVVEKMKEVKATFGFEANGGGIFSELMSRDGGRSSVEILNLLSSTKGTLSELVASLPKFYLFRDKVEYEWSLKETILKKAKEEFKGERIEELDGLKIWIDSSTWILFRSSANAPEFRVFAESKDEEKARELLTNGLALVNKIVAQKLK
jgi:phosphomannomutase/phosphoglucomutase